MKEEIIKKILEIPLDHWKDFATELNGVKIQLIIPASPLNCYFELDGLKCYSSEIKKLAYQLEELKFKQDQAIEIEKAKEVYKKIML